MSEWKEYTVGKIVDWFSGGTPSKSISSYWQGEIPWISAKTMTNHKVRISSLNISQDGLQSGSRLARKGDILLLVRGSGLFKGIPINWVDEPVAFNQDIKAARAKNPEHQEFLYFWLHGNKKRLADILEETGIGAGKFDMAELNKLTILIPDDKEERNDITAFAASIYDKIDLLHRQNQTLEAMAQTLFRQWFVEEAEEGWEEGVLGDLLEFNYGKALKNSDRKKGLFPVYGSSGIVGYHDNWHVEGPGIITGRKGTLGVINYSYQNFFPIDTTYFITSKSESEGLYFEYLLLQSVNLSEMNSDSAVPGLNRNLAHSIQVMIPPKERIKDFNNLTKPLFMKLKINQAQIKTLEQQRDILLPKLMSGEVRVEH